MARITLLKREMARCRWTMLFLVGLVAVCLGSDNMGLAPQPPEDDLASLTSTDAQAVEESTTEQAELLVCHEKVASEEKRAADLEEEASACADKFQQAAFSLVKMKTAATAAAAARANATAAVATVVDAETEAAEEAAQQKQLRMSASGECNANVELQEIRAHVLREQAKFKAETRIAELGSAYDEMETKVAQEKEALSSDMRRASMRQIATIHEETTSKETQAHEDCDGSVTALRTAAREARNAEAAQLEAAESSQEADTARNEHDLSADELETVRKAEEVRDRSLQQAANLEEQLEQLTDRATADQRALQVAERTMARLKEWASSTLSASKAAVEASAHAEEAVADSLADAAETAQAAVSAADGTH